MKNQNPTKNTMKNKKSLSPEFLAKYYFNQNEITKDVIGDYLVQRLTTVRVRKEISFISK